MSDLQNSADQAISANLITPLTGLAHNVTAPHTGNYDLKYCITVSNPNGHTSGIFYRVDGGSWIFLEAHSAPAAFVNSCTSSATILLAAGARTVELGLGHDQATSATVVWGNVAFQGVVCRSRSSLVCS